MKLIGLLSKNASIIQKCVGGGASNTFLTLWKINRSNKRKGTLICNDWSLGGGSIENRNLKKIFFFSNIIPRQSDQKNQKAAPGGRYSYFFFFVTLLKSAAGAKKETWSSRKDWPALKGSMGQSYAESSRI